MPRRSRVRRPADTKTPRVFHDGLPLRPTVRRWEVAIRSDARYRSGELHSFDVEKTPCFGACEVRGGVGVHAVFSKMFRSTGRLILLYVCTPRPGKVQKVAGPVRETKSGFIRWSACADAKQLEVQ